MKDTTVKENLSFDKYKNDESLNVSGMKLFWKSPYHYKMRKELSKSSPAMFYGSALHLRILEPEKYYTTVKEHRLKTPKMDDNGTMFLHESDIAAIEKSADTVLNDRLMSVLLPDSKKEVSISWVDEFGIKCKARFDFINMEYLIIGDIKTTKDASYEGFRKSIENYKYHWQAAHYEDGALAVYNMPFTFIFFCIEGDPIYKMAKYKCIPLDMEKARDQINWIKNEYRECLLNDNWPCYPEKIVDMELRPWA